jgi:hypothetical protein
VRKRKWLIAGGLLALLFVFVAWQVPAGLALQVARSGNPGFSFSSSSGSAWRGRAENVYWQGLALGHVEWRLQGLEDWSGLLTNWDIRGESTQYHLHGRVSVAGGELRQLTDLQASLPAAWVDLGDAMPFVYLTGTLELDLESLSLRNGLPTQGRGRIRWLEAGLGGLVNEALGDIQIDIEPPAGVPDDTLLLEFRSLQQTGIGVAGNGRLQGNDYDVNLSLSVPPDRVDLFELIGPFGQVRDDGTIDFQWRGKLFPEDS